MAVRTSKTDEIMANAAALRGSLVSAGFQSALAAMRTDRYEVTINEPEARCTEYLEGATPAEVLESARQIQATYALTDDELTAIDDEAEFEDAVWHMNMGSRIVDAVEDWIDYLQFEAEMEEYLEA